jgi:hypothetical protein
MKNVKTIISNHNTRIRSTEPTATKEIGCNCRKKDECPLQKKGLTQAIVYQAEVKSHAYGETKRYIGVTAGEFKDRYRNHKKIIRDSEIRERNGAIKAYLEIKEKRKTLQHHMVHS